MRSLHHYARALVLLSLGALCDIGNGDGNGVHHISWPSRDMEFLASLSNHIPLMSLAVV